MLQRKPRKRCQNLPSHPKRPRLREQDGRQGQDIKPELRLPEGLRLHPNDEEYEQLEIDDMQVEIQQMMAMRLAKLQPQQQ
jgi:hypothetical protein